MNPKYDPSRLDLLPHNDGPVNRLVEWDVVDRLHECSNGHGETRPARRCHCLFQ